MTNPATEAAWLHVDRCFTERAFTNAAWWVHRIMAIQAGRDDSHLMRMGFTALIRGWARESGLDAELLDCDELARRLLIARDPTFVESWSTEAGIGDAVARGELPLLIGSKIRHSPGGK